MEKKDFLLENMKKTVKYYFQKYLISLGMVKDLKISVNSKGETYSQLII